MIDRAGLKVADALASFIEDKALPGTGIDPTTFWQGVAETFARFAPENAALLVERDRLQAEIDNWHGSKMNARCDANAYRSFLSGIGYLVDEPPPFAIGPNFVDAEIANSAAPQLVVPALNARFLLNAANARWGSLYDALYGTDALSGIAAPGYDAARGARVIAKAKAFLDATIPLASGLWSNLRSGPPVLADPAQLVGNTEKGLLFKHNGLCIEVVIDATHPIGRDDPFGIADVVLESALTTIVDLEDSVAAVDAEEKVLAYTNWLALMTGTLEASFDKGGTQITRVLAADRSITTTEGSRLVLPGRSLLFVRNVGHLMRTPAVLLPDGSEAPEGILDGIVTSLCAVHDLTGPGQGRNSRMGSIYIVKPKMHGPEEASFTDRLFDAIEDLLGLDRYTIKVGVMDEERRTSANLAASIHAVKDRIVFINTGFLDRTGDEIHTSMHAGPMLRKRDMKTTEWIAAYEDRNVQIALACGFSGRAQIGKGMWTAPDRMADMLAQKIAHPLSGATTAWVPSPTAATLHATHYHAVDVFARHADKIGEPVPGLEKLLTLPTETCPTWSREEVNEELNNNAQGILGYVVRWIDQGVGCSKVPDIHDVGLMEDRATLRISSQHIANWMLHGIASVKQVDEALSAMATKVDVQNAADPLYRPMADREANNIAFRAARALVFEGAVQPNGYTEPLLHAFRRLAKSTDSKISKDRASFPEPLASQAVGPA